MMTKKEFLLKLLDSFKWSWELATNIRILVENDELDSKKIDAIYKIFLNAIDSTNEKDDNDKLKKGINILKKLKEDEDKDSIIDNKLADDLLKEIN